MMNEASRITGIIESVNAFEHRGIVKTTSGKIYLFTFNPSNAYLYRVGVSVEFEPCVGESGPMARGVFVLDNISVWDEFGGLSNDRLSLLMRRSRK